MLAVEQLFAAAEFCIAFCTCIVIKVNCLAGMNCYGVVR